MKEPTQMARVEIEEPSMNKLYAIRNWFTGENRYGGAQDLGPRGTPYFRYDHSHHLHRQIDKIKLNKRLRMLLLVVWLIVTAGIALFLNR